MRSKISRAKADMRSAAVAIESYAVDYNRHPIGYNEGREAAYWAPQTPPWLPTRRFEAWYKMTSPLAYLTSIPEDPFRIRRGNEGEAFFEYQTLKWYTDPQGPSDAGSTGANTYRRGFQWYLRCSGPMTGALSMDRRPWFREMVASKDPNTIYDPTNGTRSFGELFLTNKGFFSGDQL